MEKFLVNKTSKSPYISLEKGLFQFSGRSIPEDAKRIFKPVIDWMKTYHPDNNHKTVINFNFDYLDTSSSKCVFDILKVLDTMYEKGHEIIINWYYEEGDDDMLDLGIHLKSFVKAPFNFIENEQMIGQMEEFLTNE
jgi:SiaC family regulatory phosphoprotein